MSEDPRHTLFALQLFVPADPRVGPAGMGHRALLRRLRESELEPTVGGKERFWRSVTSTMHDLVALAHYGVWDYIDDDEQALEEYEQWCQGTIEDAQQDEPAVPHEHTGPDEPCYMFVTLLLLCDADADADLQLQEATEAVEEEPWSQASFRALLKAISELDWRAVKSDTLFVRPGDGGRGVTAEALQEEHYHYLQPLL
jgi:hypothetical protein